MYKNSLYRPNINVELDNGIYIFDSESATGKTYLCKQLKKLRAYGESVISITYNNILTGFKLDDMQEQYKVIMLDRYDLYRNIGHKLLERFKNKSIILIDCKLGYIEGLDSEICFIELTNNSIEVSL